jgi:hypothetical protein
MFAPIPIAPGVAAGVSTHPDPSGLPGGAALQHLLNGLVFVGLLSCVAAVVVGGATWFVGSQAGNFTAAIGGRRAVLAGMVGALVIGAAAAIVNFFFSAGSAVR